ncbi:hypothetical protein PCYB_093170 [Plasmodium cynomolgi strain B]|uniref:Uncharacterized protein n=1 Tax=Plasmodium cynomolgi (strain B) TaxID=1120755 RepID=K6VBI2_PLACD|nr:hypothetical protein PCYB_093170 [Plasmodium cynomolgi strain B]GAB66532.1 hypothetical protein PCYB_093170 [Plasmodium cynomolgi strain B]
MNPFNFKYVTASAQRHVLIYTTTFWKKPIYGICPDIGWAFHLAIHLAVHLTFGGEFTTGLIIVVVISILPKSYVSHFVCLLKRMSSALHRAKRGLLIIYGQTLR